MNQRFVVVRDDDGYGVWRLEELDEGAPIERFSDDERGCEAARSRYNDLTERARRGMWLRWLRWVVVVSAVMWVLTSGLSARLFLQGGFRHVRWQRHLPGARPLVSAHQPGGTSDDARRIRVYVVLWLEGRRSR